MSADRGRLLPRTDFADVVALPDVVELDDSVITALIERCERNCAERDAARASVAARDVILAALVDILRRIGGYMTPDDQATLRSARALLAEEARP